jgi:hypothetical protein
MITNRMRRMSKRRQKIELSRQALLVARAVDLNEAAAKAANDAIVTSTVGGQPAGDLSTTSATG